MQYITIIIIGFLMGFLSVPISAFLIGEAYKKEKFHVGQMMMGIYLGLSFGTGIEKLLFVVVAVVLLRLGIFLYNSIDSKQKK